MEQKGNARAQIICKGGNKEIINGEFIAVFIEEIHIDTSQFLSKDGFLFFVSKQREGVIKINLSGQSTAIPFLGEGNVLPKYLDKVAYLGSYCGWLSFDISLLELDEDTKSLVDKVQQGTEWIANISKPGSTVIKNILDVIRSQIENDEEARAFLIHEKVLLDNQKLVLLFGNSKNPLMKITLRIESLGMISQETTMSVRIIRPRLLFKDEKQAISELKRKNMEVFNFEAGSGTKQSTYTTDIQRFFNTVTWEGNEVFHVRASNVGHYLFPLLINFSINTKHFQADSICKSAQAAMGILEICNIKNKPSQTIVKQMPTILNLLSEITEDNFSIFSFNGFAVLEKSPNNNASPQSLVPCPGKLVLKYNSKRNLWSTTVQKNLTWRNNQFGTFEFTLEVREIPKLSPIQDKNANVIKV